MTNYETVLDDVVDKLETAVKACDSFNENNVHVDYFRREDYGEEDVICLIQLMRDSSEDIGARETRHVFTFRLKISHPGTGVKEDLTDLISYVDEIITQIESSRTLGSTYITNTETPDVEYSMEAPQNAVIYHAFMTVEVEAVRNDA